VGATREGEKGEAMSKEALKTRVVNGVLNEVLKERMRQHEKWGEQNHHDGTSTRTLETLIEETKKCREETHGLGPLVDYTKALCDKAAREEWLTWSHILWEEFAEALSEENEAGLRTELVQVAAVAVAWVETIDRRRKKP
jgi:hypothetical protein